MCTTTLTFFQISPTIVKAKVLKNTLPIFKIVKVKPKYNDKIILLYLKCTFVLRGKQIYQYTTEY